MQGKKNEKKKKRRIKSFTRDTSLAIEQTSNCLVDAYRYLLSSGFKFVMPGEFNGSGNSFNYSLKQLT